MFGSAAAGSPAAWAHNKNLQTGRSSTLASSSSGGSVDDLVAAALWLSRLSGKSGTSPGTKREEIRRGGLGRGEAGMARYNTETLPKPRAGIGAGLLLRTRLHSRRNSSPLR